MQPHPSHGAGPALPGKMLITLGLIGGGLLALAAVAPAVLPGALGVGLSALGEILLILAAFGLQQRSGSPLWLLAGLLMGLCFLGTLSGLGRMTIGVGLLSGIGSFVAALAWGLMGITLLARRNDGHPGVGVGAGLVSLLRAVNSFFLAIMPFFGFLGLDPTIGLWSWRVMAFFSSALVALFCATAIAKPAARPAAGGWQPPPGYGPPPPPYGQQPPPGGYR